MRHYESAEAMKREYALEAFDSEDRFSQQIDVFGTFREAHAEMTKEQKNRNFSGEGETLGITEIVYDENGEELSHERVI
jgi:hypothetical protein